MAVFHSDGVTANPRARRAKHYLCVLLTLARWSRVTPSRRHELGKVTDGPHAVAHIHAQSLRVGHALEHVSRIYVYALRLVDRFARLIVFIHEVDWQHDGHVCFRVIIEQRTAVGMQLTIGTHARRYIGHPSVARRGRCVIDWLAEFVLGLVVLHLPQIIEQRPFVLAPLNGLLQPVHGLRVVLPELAVDFLGVAVLTNHITLVFNVYLYHLYQSPFFVGLCVNGDLLD